MTSNKEDFFEDIHEWSQRKLNILKRYVDGFARILGGAYEGLYYVDGFAGKGVYGKGEKGSPVLAAELAASPRYAGKLHCIFIEKNPEYYNDLIKHTNQYRSVIQIFQGTFSNKIDGILPDLNGFPCLFFIDDFGVKGSDWPTVEKVLARKYITDVWIRFDHKTIRRLDGCFSSPGKGATEKTNLLGGYFGISDPCKLHDLLDAPSAEGRIQRAVNLYKNRLLEVLGVNGFAGAYPITSLDGFNKYHLLFVCKNTKAAILASDIVNGVEDDLPIKQAKHRETKHLEETGQLALFDTSPTPDQLLLTKIDIIKPLILSYIYKGELTVAEIHYALLRNNPELFGRFRRKHITRALKELMEELKICLSGAPSNDETKVIAIHRT
jgi:three-Cys-motif partner protein